MPKADSSWQALAGLIRRNLGDGMVDVELTTDQMDDAISQSLREYRTRAENSHKEGWAWLGLSNTQRIYQLPPYITDVMKVESLGQSFGDGFFERTQLGNFLYEHYLSGQTFDLLTFHLERAFLETLEELSAQAINFRFHNSFDGSQIGYPELDANEIAQLPDTQPSGQPEPQSGDMQFNVADRVGGPFIELLRTPRSDEEVVLLNVRYSRTDAELINDRDTGRWIERWAEAEAKIKLGRAYQKFQSIPGPGGGLSLPGADLIQEGKDDKEKLEQDLLDFLYGETPADIFFM